LLCWKEPKGVIGENWRCFRVVFQKWKFFLKISLTLKLKGW
jgi:hypothetical protein